MRFVVSGLDKENAPTVLYQGEVRADAVKCFEESLHDVERFAVIEIRSGKDGEPSDWLDVMRQETAAKKPKKTTPAIDEPSAVVAPAPATDTKKKKP